MRTLIILTVFIFFALITNAQTVIEMTHPGDANLVLLEVDDISKADIAVYKTDKKEEYEEWDCKWKFKSWGFSNFSVYLTKDKNDPKLLDEETGIHHVFHGKIFFTDDKTLCGYKTEGFMLEGVLRVEANNTRKDKKDKK